MTRPLSARLVLLAAAAALALSLVWAVIAAEMRDVDGPAKGSGGAEVSGPRDGARAVRVEARR